jgi:hypothetical protein
MFWDGERCGSDTNGLAPGLHAFDPRRLSGRPREFNRSLWQNNFAVQRSIRSLVIHDLVQIDFGAGAIALH